jgi:hypothetical protein
MVKYQGHNYFLISKFGELIEIAPTKHGAGSFIVHADFVEAA